MARDTSLIQLDRGEEGMIHSFPGGMCLKVHATQLAEFSNFLTESSLRSHSNCAIQIFLYDQLSLYIDIFQSYPAFSPS